jgi:hypothetical protein
MHKRTAPLTARPITLYPSHFSLPPPQTETTPNPTPKMVNRGSTATAQELEGLTKGELLGMLSFGADRIFANDSNKGGWVVHIDGSQSEGVGGSVGCS